METLVADILSIMTLEKLPGETKETSNCEGWAGRGENGELLQWYSVSLWGERGVLELVVM